MPQNNDNPFKTDGKSPKTVHPNEIDTEKFKREISDICDSLLVETKDYNPESTLNLINEYLHMANGQKKILYAPINTFLYGLDDEKFGKFETNIESLLCCNENHCSPEQREFIMKVYDHCELVKGQNSYIQKSLASNIIAEERKMETTFNEKLGDAQKDYISILGIFSAVVLTFTGGIAFSTSVLQNIHQASPYRVIAGILLIALVLLNIIYMLFHYVEKIVHGKDSAKSKWAIIIVDGIIAALLGALFAAWWWGCVEKRNKRFSEEQPIPEISAENEETAEKELSELLRQTINQDVHVDIILPDPENSEKGENESGVNN